MTGSERSSMRLHWELTKPICNPEEKGNGLLSSDRCKSTTHENISFFCFSQAKEKSPNIADIIHLLLRLNQEETS